MDNYTTRLAKEALHEFIKYAVHNNVVFDILLDGASVLFICNVKG